MGYTVTIKFADDSTKDFTIESDVNLPSGLGLAPTQIASLLNAINCLMNLMGTESWKTVEIDVV